MIDGGIPYRIVSRRASPVAAGRGARPCRKPYRNASKAMLYPLLLERQG